MQGLIWRHLSYSDYQNLRYIYILYMFFFYFFLLKYIMCDKTHHFMGKKQTNILH